MALITEVISPGPGADITAALQEAAAASPIVRLAGAGMIGAPIVLQQGGRLEGVAGASLTLADAACATVIDATAGGVTISDVVIDGQKLHPRTVLNGSGQRVAGAGALVRMCGHATTRNMTLRNVGKYGLRLDLITSQEHDGLTVDGSAGHEGIQYGACHMVYCTGSTIPGGQLVLRRPRLVDTQKQNRRWGSGGVFVASNYGASPFMPTQVICTDGYFELIGAEVPVPNGIEQIGSIDLYINCPNSIIARNRFVQFVHIAMKLGSASDCLADGNIVESALPLDPNQLSATGVADVGPRQAMSWNASFPTYGQMHHGFVARNNRIRGGREGIAVFGRGEVRDGGGNVLLARIAARGVRLEGNDITTVAGSGIYLRDLEGPEILNNRTDGCSNHGVDAQRVSGAVRVLSHRAANCGGRGVYITGMGQNTDVEVRGHSVTEFTGNAGVSVDSIGRAVVNDGLTRVTAGAGKTGVRIGLVTHYAECRGNTSLIPGGKTHDVATPSAGGAAARRTD